MMKHDLARYDAYKDSGVEWLGDVPSAWLLNRHKDNFTFVTDTCVNSSLKKVGLENIEGKTGQFIFTESEFDGNGVEFKENDVLFGKLRPYLAKVYLSQFSGNAVGDIFVYRPKRNTVPKFAQYLMLSDSYINVINSSTAGAKMPRVSSSFIANLPISTPPLPEQKAIADYLDTKTAQIDRKIDLLTQKATQYGKLKQSLINETVTRGLDKTVAMKDSGVEWIGEVPEHWDVLPLKELASKSTGSFVDGPFGSDLKSNEYTDEGVPLIQLNNIGIGFHSTKNLKFISEDKSLSLSKHRAFPGEIAIAKMAEPVARATVISNAFPMYVIVADCIKFKPNSRILDNNFIAYALNTTGVKSQAEVLSNGTTRIRINLGTTKTLKVVTPPLLEQKAIADYLDTKTARIDRIVETINTQIDKLKELRKTLINDVVTGKIKVA